MPGMPGRSGREFRSPLPDSTGRQLEKTELVESCEYANWLWDAVVEMLPKEKLDTVDTVALEQFAIAYEIGKRNAQQVINDPTDKDAFRQWRDSMNIFRNFCRQFGVGPMDRAAMKLPVKELDPLDEFVQ